MFLHLPWWGRPRRLSGIICTQCEEGQLMRMSFTRQDWAQQLITPIWRQFLVPGSPWSLSPPQCDRPCMRIMFAPKSPSYIIIKILKYEKDFKMFECIQRRACDWEEAGLSSLERRRLRGGLIALQFPEEMKQRGRCRPLLPGHQEQDTWEQPKVAPEKVRLDVWKKFFTMRVVRHWHRFREVVVALPQACQCLK